MKLTDIENAYDYFFQITEDSNAASQLVLAAVMKGIFDSDNFAHNICMGIRKGLFGASASQDTSILDPQSFE